MATVLDARIIELPKFLDARGNLSFAEQNNQIPFEIKRTYWLYDVPGGETRGGHAYKKNEEFIIALSGSFDVILDDGEKKKVFTLNRESSRICRFRSSRGMNERPVSCMKPRSLKAGQSVIVQQGRSFP